MCIRHQYHIVHPTGERQFVDTYAQRCSPPCPRPQISRLQDQFLQAQVMDPFVDQTPVIRPRQAGQDSILIQRVSTTQRANPLRLRWSWHIPGTSREGEGERERKPRTERTTFVVPLPPLQGPTMGLAPITPPVTPIQIQPSPPPIRIPEEAIFETIAPRTPVREHHRPRPIPAPVAPPRDRSRERRLRRRREEEDRILQEERVRRREREDRILAERQAAIEARIQGLRAQESARRIALEEARLEARTRAQQERIRVIDEEIASLRAQLEREQRHRRRAQPNILHQDNNPRASRHARDEDRERERQRDREREREQERERHHRSGFRPGRQDPGGGQDRDGEDGLDGNTASRRTARQRALDREIRNLEEQVGGEDRGRRRRRETLPTSSAGAVANGTAPFFDPFRRHNTRARERSRVRAAGVRVENRNTFMG